MANSKNSFGQIKQINQLLNPALHLLFKLGLTPLLVERARGETQLFVKEVKIDEARYILCRNEAEAERDRSERQAIVAGLTKQLARGDKALIMLEL